MLQREQAVNEDSPPHSADRMPTLTEVLELDSPSGAEGARVSAHDEGAPVLADTTPLEPMLDTQSLVSEVLAELQPRIDMLFDSRLREALAPALARAAEGLIREARSELGSALHELVDDAVKRALQRRGGRW